MPVYQLDLQTKVGNEYVSNVYHVVATSLATANDQGIALANIHAATIPAFWSIDYLRTSTPTPGDEEFIATPLNIPGTRSVSGQQLPLFNRFRVRFQCASGRPGVKFLVGVAEVDVNGTDFETSAITFIETAYLQPIYDDTDLVLCRPDGTLFGAGALQRAVGMRQLRRASKRKTPVIGG